MKTLNLEGEEKKEGKFTREAFEMLYFAYRPFKTVLIAILSTGFIGRMMVLGNSNVIGYWVDSLSQTAPAVRPPPSFLSGYTNWDYILLLSVLCLCGFVLSLIFRVAFSRLSAQAISSIYDEVTLRTSRYPMAFFDRNPAGKIITRFSSDYGNMFRMFGGPLAEFFSIIFDLIIIVLLLGFASPFYLIIVAFIAIFNYVLFKANQMRLREARRELSASRSPSISHFAETTQGANNIRVYNKQRNFIDRFSELDQIFLNKKQDTTNRILNFSLQMNGLSSLMFLATGLLSWYLTTHSMITVGSIGVAFGLITLASSTVTMFFEWFSQLEEAMVGAERLNQFLRHSTEPGNPLPSTSKFPTHHWRYKSPLNLDFDLLKQKNASLEVRDLWLSYSEYSPWILKNINFKIEPGERIGLVGPTGSGKTSLIQAIFYLYELNKGQILIDGMKPKLSQNEEGLDLNLYRRSISLISQEPTLFQGTLRDNLDPLGLHTDIELQRALKQVDLVYIQLGDWIEEKGKNLSMGEKQLVCMARCLLQSSPIVIMDEATSNVDPQSEQIMVRATEEIFQGRTQIIIAHRLSTLQKCDRILWLEHGEVRKFAPTEEVLREFKLEAH